MCFVYGPVLFEMWLSFFLKLSLFDEYLQGAFVSRGEADVETVEKCECTVIRSDDLGLKTPIARSDCFAV